MHRVPMQKARAGKRQGYTLLSEGKLLLMNFAINSSDFSESAFVSASRAVTQFLIAGTSRSTVQAVNLA
jgi:hypothetical protein